jgi:hypothetical protein
MHYEIMYCYYSIVDLDLLSWLPESCVDTICEFRLSLVEKCGDVIMFSMLYVYILLTRLEDMHLKV